MGNASSTNLTPILSCLIWLLSIAYYNLSKNPQKTLKNAIVFFVGKNWNGKGDTYIDGAFLSKYALYSCHLLQSYANSLPRIGLMTKWNIRPWKNGLTQHTKNT
jgi:hypothetical protein